MNHAKRADDFTEKGEVAAYVAGYEDALEDAAAITAPIVTAAAKAAGAYVAGYEDGLKDAAAITAPIVAAKGEANAEIERLRLRFAAIGEAIESRDYAAAHALNHALPEPTAGETKA
jgi:hypothetical protein